MSKPDLSLERLIAGEIEQSGPISFARFMERALYEPGLGYYEREREIGKRGDYFTSVSVGDTFGQLLAFQFAEWLPASGPVQIVEAGAHDGRLAGDILNWLAKRQPKLLERLEYRLIEPSRTHQLWQQATLKEFEGTVNWAADLEGAGPIRGVVFSNELLDAMPVHRLRWNAARAGWEEWMVTWDGEEFGWETRAANASALQCAPMIAPELSKVITDGFVLEVSPAAVVWWREAAALLKSGRLLTIDYGFTREERLQPERHAGTLRAYAGHTSSADVLGGPGEQDLTAHVDFTALEEAGLAAGLRTDTLDSQEVFLTRLFQRTTAQPTELVDWTPPRLKQLQTLIHPAHLGRVFRVLVQTRV